MRGMCGHALAVVVCLASSAELAAAQSQIWGRVGDERGGGLPGVTIELTSGLVADSGRPVVMDIGLQAPVSRVTVSGDGGRYGFITLPAGTYEVTYSLPGFSTYVVDTFSVPSNALVRLDAGMSVGALEETVTALLAEGELEVADLPERSRILGKVTAHRFSEELGGVSVEVVRSRTGLWGWFPERHEGVTDDGGHYDFDGLAPGSYTVEFTMPGWHTSVVDQLELPPNAVLQIDIEMIRSIGDDASEETITFSPNDERGYVKTRVHAYHAIDSP